MTQTLAPLIFAILLSPLFVSCVSHEESEYIDVADHLLWENPDSCIKYIQPKGDLVSLYGKNRLKLINQHAYFKISGKIESDTILNQLIAFFTKNEYYSEAGEAEYILGAHYVQQGKFFEATSCLKLAEYLFQKENSIKPALMGMLYFNLGIASEQCRLFDIAIDYCNLAIPYLRKSNNPIYISVCYHLLGKSHYNKDTRLMYIDSALFYSKDIKSVYHKEIEATKYQILNSTSYEGEMIANYIYLCDSCHEYSYAAEIATYYIDKGEYKKAQDYLNLLAQDTSINIWSKEQYFSIKADLHWVNNHKKEAYKTLKWLHEWQTKEIEQSAYASTYIISQRYDAAKEQEMRLQEQVKKQRAYFWIAIIMMICVLIGGYTYYINKKRKLELRISKEEKKRLEEELNTNRAVLRARISERLEVARHLHFWSSHHSEDIPDILGPLSPKQAASDQQNWREFCKEFDLCYGNLLLRLKKDFPALTDSDLQYIVITFLDFDMTDMSFLLQITNRTIWNRRNSVKQHIGMSENTNLDNWIINDMAKEYNIAEPKRNPRKKRK